MKISALAALFLMFASIANAKPGDGVLGRFDPSDRVDPSNPNLIWRSYSAVDPSVNGLWVVSTKIAFSTNKGASFTDLVTVNPGIDSPEKSQNEVSTLVFDPSDPNPQAKWKLIWMHYYSDRSNVMDTSRAWFAMRAAPSPIGPWSPEVKFMAGSLYNPNNTTSPGAPLITMPECLAVSEPAALGTPDGFYFAYQCHKGSAAATSMVVSLSKLTRKPGLAGTATGPTTTFTTAPTPLLSATDSLLFRIGYTRRDPANELNTTVAFGAPELFEKNGAIYVMATPVTPAYEYRGCVVFQIADLANAKILKNGSIPLLIKNISGPAGSFRGACTYSSASTGSGVVLPVFTPPALFQLHNSMIQVP